MPSVQIIGSDTLSSALIEEARQRLMAIGSHPILCPAARREPMRGDPAVLAVLIDDSKYHASMISAVEDTVQVYTISSRDPAPPRVEMRKPERVPFWRNLPKFKRRR